MSLFKKIFCKKIIATIVSRTFYSTPIDNDYNNLDLWCGYTIKSNDKGLYGFRENLGSQRLIKPEDDILPESEPTFDILDVISIYKNKITGKLLSKTARMGIKNKGIHEVILTSL